MHYLQISVTLCMNKKKEQEHGLRMLQPRFSSDNLGDDGCAVRSSVLWKVSKTEIKEMVYKL